MLNQINTQIFHFVNNWAYYNFFADMFAIFLAQYSPFIFIAYLIYLWFRSDYRKTIVLFAVYSTILSLSLNFLIGIFYFHPRPFMDFPGVNLISHKAENSLPSDHSTFMLSIAFVLFLFKQTKKQAFFWAFLALIGGFARVYCGVHYPFDVFASIITSLFSVLLIVSNKEKFKQINIKIIDFYYRFLNLIKLG